MRNATIAGLGLHAPGQPIPNSDFNEKYGKDVDTFLRERRNIHQRHFMSADQATSDLIVPAAKTAMKRAGIEAMDLDLIIVATDTPDFPSPATSTVVQHKLGAKNAGTFDLNCACAGFVTAMDVGSKYIRADDRYRNILVVGAYGMSKHFDWSDYKIASMFADGAGAVILQPTRDPEFGILSSELYAEGQYFDFMGIYGGGTHLPMTSQALEQKAHQLNFAKRIPLETNTIHWPRITRVILDRANAKIEDVSKFFVTQLNIETIDSVLKLLEVSPTLSHNIMDKYGYTGSACIPMALTDAAEKHLLKKGDLILLIGSGGGLAMGGVAMRWSYDT